MTIIVINKEEKTSNANININIKGDKVTINADNIEYEEFLKALEGLAYATTKAGQSIVKSPLDIYNVMHDISEVIVDARDSAFEDLIK